MSSEPTFVTGSLLFPLGQWYGLHILSWRSSQVRWLSWCNSRYWRQKWEVLCLAAGSHFFPPSCSVISVFSWWANSCHKPGQLCCHFLVEIPFCGSRELNISTHQAQAWEPMARVWQQPQPPYGRSISSSCKRSRFAKGFVLLSQTAGK